MLDPSVIRFRLNNAGQTAALGATVAEACSDRPGLVIYMEGPLGAGKTTLARGLLHGLGVQGHIKSPTYTLMELYQGGGKSILHIDLYRMSSPIELENLGLTDYPPEQTWWLVEWPERGAGWLPQSELTIRLAYAGQERVAELDFSTAGAALRNRIERRVSDRLHTLSNKSHQE